MILSGRRGIKQCGALLGVAETGVAPTPTKKSKQYQPNKQKNGWQAIRFLPKTQLFNDKVLDSRENLVAVVGMNGKSDRIEQVKAENTHDRLCIYNISAAGKVDFLIELADNLYKISYCFYGRKTDFYRFHNNILLTLKFYFIHIYNIKIPS